MNMRSISRYKSLYPPIRTHIIPLNYRHLWFAPKFDTIYNEASLNENIHVHCLSGGVLQYTRFLRRHKDIADKVVTEVYDNPSHAEGFVNFIHQTTYFSPKICKKMLKWWVPEPMEQSKYFLNHFPLTNARRLVIRSENDIICPSEHIKDMIDRWSIDNIWTNDCFHLHSLRKYPNVYKEHMIKALGQKSFVA